MLSKQVIVLRTKYPDGRGGFFKARLGKLAAQAAHASMKVFFDRRDPQAPYAISVPLWPEAVPWVNESFVKIVVGCETAEALLEVYQKAQAAKLACALIEDEGRTEFHGIKTPTAVAIGPAEASAIDAITGHLSLL